MRKTPDLKNKRFGRLVVLDLSDGYVDEKYKRRGWVCECDCGNVVLLRGDVIQRENTYGCGCGAGSHLKTHGLSKHPLHSIWKGMKARCYNNKCEAYKNYGGRGILVCDEWLDNFTTFFEWSLSNGWEVGLEIDRQDNDGNYEPNNCRFVTQLINARNKRGVKLSKTKAAEIRKLLANGVGHSDIASQFGVSVSSISLINLNKTWN